MVKLRLVLPTALLFLTGILVAAGQTSVIRVSDPVDMVDAKSKEVIENHLRFRGRSDDLAVAMENIRSLQTLIMEGTITENNARYSVTAGLEFPDKLRFDAVRENLDWKITTKTVFTLTNSYSQQLTPRKEDPHKLSVIEQNGLKNYLDYAAPIIDWATKSHQFRHRGEVMLGKQRAILLRATLEDGSVRYYYFHPEKYHLLCVGLIDTVEGKLVEADWFPSKVSRVGPAHLETGWVCSVKGKEYRQVDWRTTTANPVFEQGFFE